MKWALLPIAICFAFTVTSDAAQVLWSSKRFANNLSSDGTPLSEDFTFQLGAFKDGFEPTAENVSEWLTHWVPAQSAPYNPRTQFFAGSHVFSENQEPFVPSNQAYIFGFDRLAKSGATEVGEWILATNPVWRWPIAGSGISLPTQWSVSSASEVVVGSVDASAEEHMTTESVELELEEETPELWRQRYLAGQGADMDWTADPDGDGVANLLEYVTGGNPLLQDQGGAISQTLATTGDEVHMELALIKNGLLEGISVSVEASEDLINWVPADEDVEMIENTEAIVRFRDLQPVGTGNRYLRIVASL